MNVLSCTVKLFSFQNILTVRGMLLDLPRMFVFCTAEWLRQHNLLSYGHAILHMAYVTYFSLAILSMHCTVSIYTLLYNMR